MSIERFDARGESGPPHLGERIIERGIVGVVSSSSLAFAIKSAAAIPDPTGRSLFLEVVSAPLLLLMTMT